MRAPRIAQRVMVIVAVMAGVAARPADAQLLSDSTGTYRYEARSGSTIISQGTFTVTADSVIVEATPGPCRPVVGSSKAGAIRYDCGHVTLAFDRVRPLTRSHAYSSKTMIEKRPVCMVEGRDAQGRTICVKMGNESYEKEFPVTALIRVIKG